MPRKKKNTSKSFDGFLKVLKSLFTVVVLTGFVLGISFVVKTIATSDAGDLLAVAAPLFAKFNLDQNRVGTVAGDFVSRLGQTGVVKSAGGAKIMVDQNTGAGSSGGDAPATAPQADVEFKVAILSDAHGFYDNLGKSLTTAKSFGATMVFFLGDYTDLGVTDDLAAAKKVMDASKLVYLSLPGDHDLWKSVGPQNFIDVFGENYFSKTINSVKFVGLDNSANYTVIDTALMAWFKKELSDADFVLLSQPLYHPSNDIAMGIVNGQENQNVRRQALELLELIRASKVKAIIAGDQHLSSSNIDPVRGDLAHVVVGALAAERNLQSTRFSLMNVLKSGGYQIEDVLLN